MGFAASLTSSKTQQKISWGGAPYNRDTRIHRQRGRDRALFVQRSYLFLGQHSVVAAAAVMGWCLLDLEKHFAFYGAYHSDPVNVLIHALFVWPIFFTTLLLLYFTPPFFHLAAGTLVFNLGFAVAALYAFLYVSLDRRAGSLAALLCALCWVGSSVLGSCLGFSLAWRVVLAAQSLCWTGMFIGHGVFEGRSPALLKNGYQAVLMAPFFVLLEVLHKFFGYEPYPGFHDSVHAKIEAERKTWHISKQKSS